MRYKAFISYSHADLQWAGWLHKALETYRTPRRLVGADGLHGKVTARLTPVFRDRDELSTASHLSDTIREALSQSDSMVVICSPAAAASNWVNEEIRLFQSLGRGDRIHCLIVDGDPQSKDPANRCFPPALIDGENERSPEPLAADARKWADGKKLARQKLLAGILGVRLDELRQRDLQRKRRFQAAAGVLATAILALIVFAITSQIAERDAQVARETQRASAEAMLAQFLEQSERLGDVADLETRKAFGEVLSTYLVTLDTQQLTRESRRQLGVALANRGVILRAEGHLDEAMTIFLNAHETLKALVDDDRTDPNALFELSQVEYWIGQVHLDHGRMQEAERRFQAYAEASTTLHQLKPGNADWTMEVAYAHSNLANLERRRTPSDPQRVLEHYRAALDFNLEAARQDSAFESELADSHADLADAWRGVCALEQANHHRLKNVELAAIHYGSNPASNRAKLDYTYSLSGLAWVQADLGLLEQALNNVRLSHDLLAEIALEDPLDQNTQWQLARKRVHLAQLNAYAGNREQGRKLMLQVWSDIEELVRKNRDLRVENEVFYARIPRDLSAWHLYDGDLDRGRALLQESVERMDAAVAAHPNHRQAVQQRARTWSDFWSAQGEFPAGVGHESLSSARSQLNGASCTERDLVVRLDLMLGNHVKAREQAGLLLELNYRHPAFMQFCTSQGLCDSGTSAE